MLGSVILVLREVLEAALIVSLLLALTYKLKVSRSWGVLALACGVIGSIVLARYTLQITEAFDGTGQELVNSLLLLVVITALLAVGWLLLPLVGYADPTAAVAVRPHLLIYCLMVVTVGCAMAREGCEIWIYLSSFIGQKDTFYPTVIGGAIGAGIGISLGAIAYYFFIFMPKRTFIVLYLIVTTLVIGGLAMQVGKELMQIGLLDSSLPVWDSSFLVEEHSLSGELLYALLGYEAKPTAVQFLLYLLAISPIAIGLLWQLCRLKGARA